MAIKNQDTSITNVHGDHVASCLCCTKFSGSMGESDWSEVTPGSPVSIDCDDGEFSFGARQLPVYGGEYARKAGG